MSRVTVHVDREIEDLIPMFMENRKLDVARLRAGHASGDFVELKRIGHDLKGLGDGYGFPQVTTLGRQIEAAAIACDGEKLAKLIDEYGYFIDNVKIEIV